MFYESSAIAINKRGLSCTLGFFVFNFILIISDTIPLIIRLKINTALFELHTLNKQKLSYSRMALRVSLVTMFSTWILFWIKAIISTFLYLRKSSRYHHSSLRIALSFSLDPNWVTPDEHCILNKKIMQNWQMFKIEFNKKRTSSKDISIRHNSMELKSTWARQLKENLKIDISIQNFMNHITWLHDFVDRRPGTKMEGRWLLMVFLFVIGVHVRVALIKTLISPKLILIHLSLSFKSVSGEGPTWKSAFRGSYFR